MPLSTRESAFQVGAYRHGSNANRIFLLISGFDVVLSAREQSLLMQTLFMWGLCILGVYMAPFRTFSSAVTLDKDWRT